MQELEKEENSGSAGKYVLLYVPFLASLAFSADSVISYFIAWLGSFAIFYFSFTNKVKPTHAGLSMAEKIFRPLFLTQIIFAGYMACTSVFNFLDALGFVYLTKVPYKVVDHNQVALTAGCQRYYVLGHAAFVHGMLVFYKSNIVSKYKIEVTNWPLFFIKFGVVAAVVGLGLSKVPGLTILGGSVEGLAFVASTIGLALSIPLKKPGLTVIAGIIFGGTMLRALTSGFKEPVIVSFLMLGLFLYPFYKRIILTVFIPLMLVLFTVLPTYVNTYRSQNWSGEKSAEEAKEEALQKVREQMNGEGLAETNWEFLTGRLSEIGIFTKYKDNIDNGGDFYGVQILAQTLVALVPRVFWRDKPLTENVVAVRVIENGIVEEGVFVSAKPQYIVDGYLSFGVAGIWVFLFLYGMLAQVISNKAEALFGGYFFGVSFVFTGLMGAMWRGNCFEFIFNQIFYSFLALLTLSVALRKLKIVVEKNDY